LILGLFGVVDALTIGLWSFGLALLRGTREIFGFGLRFVLIFGVSSFSILRLSGLGSDYLFIFSYLIGQYDDSTLGRVGPFKLEGWTLRRVAASGGTFNNDYGTFCLAPLAGAVTD